MGYNSDSQPKGRDSHKAGVTWRIYGLIRWLSFIENKKKYLSATQTFVRFMSECWLFFYSLLSFCEILYNLNFFKLLKCAYIVQESKINLQITPRRHVFCNHKHKLGTTALHHNM